MASASPVAIMILIAMISAIILPLLWWLLAYYQRKKQLHRLSKISFIFSFTPVLSVLGLYLREEISAKYLLIAFAATPFINVIAIIIACIITYFKLRNKASYNKALNNGRTNGVRPLA